MVPVLYSFRRCPYAMRARLAVNVAGVVVEQREILLRDKPEVFLAASPSGTVPCLVTDDGVIDESLEVMIWALQQNDPQDWLAMPEAGWRWIQRGDGPFKRALDRVKYASRHAAAEVAVARAEAVAFFDDLEAALLESPGAWLFGKPTLADYALLPFVRQFALVDWNWFMAQPWPRVQDWLARFLASGPFAEIMEKRAVWAA